MTEKELDYVKFVKEKTSKLSERCTDMTGIKKELENIITEAASKYLGLPKMDGDDITMFSSLSIHALPSMLFLEDGKRYNLYTDNHLGKTYIGSISYRFNNGCASEIEFYPAQPIDYIDTKIQFRGTI